MKFVTVRDFRNSSRDIWEKVNNDEDVIVTNNGKPTAILVNVSEDTLEEVLAGIRQARAMRAFNHLQEQASSNKHMDDTEINSVIKAYRNEKRNMNREATV
jgi:prevent-host-death family protein